MTDKKIIAVVGATGRQGGGLVRAILDDQSGGFAVRALVRRTAGMPHVLRAIGTRLASRPGWTMAEARRRPRRCWACRTGTRLSLTGRPGRPVRPAWTS
ncbi:NmrA family NAD(P)-binding protein [Nonomuraea sp. 3N208]|uniref:NmrA family NAD(P)-binding protein n=1 Tax=Nonomuraea sp. 3N208 TaxID=3457421 RepID=UPI003FD518B5